jgi:hypothetical protein
VKYCKFKSVDISKCLNNGTTPLRGNPNEQKEEEDELEKEFKKIQNEEMQYQHGSKLIKNIDRYINVFSLSILSLINLIFIILNYYLMTNKVNTQNFPQQTNNENTNLGN